MLSIALLALFALPLVAGRTRTTSINTVPTVKPRPVNGVPEPGAIALFALGAGIVAYGVRRKRQG